MSFISKLFSFCKNPDVIENINNDPISPIGLKPIFPQNGRIDYFKIDQNQSNLKKSNKAIFTNNTTSKTSENIQNKSLTNNDQNYIIPQLSLHLSSQNSRYSSTLINNNNSTQTNESKNNFLIPILKNIDANIVTNTNEQKYDLNQNNDIIVTSENQQLKKPFLIPKIQLQAQQISSISNEKSISTQQSSSVSNSQKLSFPIPLIPSINLLNSTNNSIHKNDFIIPNIPNQQPNPPLSNNQSVITEIIPQQFKANTPSIINYSNEINNQQQNQKIWKMPRNLEKSALDQQNQVLTELITQIRQLSGNSQIVDQQFQTNNFVFPDMNIQQQYPMEINPKNLQIQQNKSTMQFQMQDITPISQKQSQIQFPIPQIQLQSKLQNPAFLSDPPIVPNVLLPTPQIQQQNVANIQKSQILPTPKIQQLQNQHKQLPTPQIQIQQKEKPQILDEKQLEKIQQQKMAKIMQLQKGLQRKRELRNKKIQQITLINKKRAQDRAALKLSKQQDSSKKENTSSQNDNSQKPM